MLAIAMTPPAIEAPAEMPAIGMSEERWCATIGKNTAQCAWRRQYGFDVPLPPRNVPGWPDPSTYLGGVPSAPPCAQYGGCIGQAAEEPPERPWWLLSILGGILLAGAGVMYYQARKEERKQRYGD